MLSTQLANILRNSYFPSKYPEHANKWLVSRIAVRAKVVNVTAHCEGCNTYSGHIITETLTKSCCDVIIYR